MLFNLQTTTPNSSYSFLILIILCLWLVTPAFATNHSSLPRGYLSSPPTIERNGGPDEFGYTYKDQAESNGPVFSWIPLSAPVVLLNSRPPWIGTGNPLDNDYSGPFSIGFDFDFYGTTHSQFYIGTNGYITFEAGSSVIPSVGIWPTTGLPDAICFWGQDNALLSFSLVRYQLITGTQNKLVIEVDSLVAANASSQRLSAQIVLYDDGRILLQYRGFRNGIRTNFPGNVGIQSAGGVYSVAYSTTATNAPNSYSAIEFIHPCNLLSLTSPLNGTISLLPSPLTLCWTGGSCTDSYDVYLDTTIDNVTNSNPSALVASEQTSTSFTFSPLNHQQYYWKVVAHGTQPEVLSSPVWLFNTWQPLTGTKTIGGTNADFISFSAALNVLAQAGVGSGGVEFEVLPDTYNEQVIVNDIRGTNSSNPVVFHKSSGTVTICPSTTSAEGAGVKLNGCRWVTFDGIDINDTSRGSNHLEYGYWVTNATTTQGSQYNTVKNSSIKLRKDFVTYGMYQNFNANAYPSSNDGSQSFNKYINLKISLCRNGIYLNSNTDFQDTDIEVGSDSGGIGYRNRFTIGALPNDTIGGPGTACGIYLFNLNGLSIHDVDITKMITTSPGVYSIYGINNYQPAGPVVVNNCRIFNLTTTHPTSFNSVYAIYQFNPINASCRYFNNMIYDLRANSNSGSATSTYYVFGINNILGDCTFDNNTVLIDQGIGANLNCSSSAIYLSSGNDTLRNNIIANITGSQSAVAHHIGIYCNGTTLVSNHNCFDIPTLNDGGYVGFYNGYKTTIDVWQQSASNLDDFSVSGDPHFVCMTFPSNPHICNNQDLPIVESAGIPLPYINNDIDNDARNMIVPDIGADEGDFCYVAPTPPSEPVISLEYVKRTQYGDTTDVTIYWSRPSGSVSGYEVYRDSNSGLFETNPERLISTINDPAILEYHDISVTGHFYYRVVSFNSTGTTSNR